jgi:alpha-1,6-mannosyltransferase
MAPKNAKQLKRKILNTLPNFLPFAITFLHVYLSPYTKVEESFTLHAVHDVLAFGPGLKYFKQVRMMSK